MNNEYPNWTSGLSPQQLNKIEKEAIEEAQKHPERTSQVWRLADIKSEREKQGY